MSEHNWVEYVVEVECPTCGLVSDEYIEFDMENRSETVKSETELKCLECETKVTAKATLSIRFDVDTKVIYE